MSNPQDIIPERCTLSLARQQRLRSFWPTVYPLRVLADEWGCSEAHISQQAKRMGLPSRKERMNELRVASRDIPKAFSSAYITVEAVKRGISADKLIVQILTVIVRDKLVTAILDDQKAA